MDKKTYEGLPAEVAAKYECLIMPCRYITKAPQRVEVDLTKITLAQADALYEKGLLPVLSARREAATDPGRREGVKVAIPVTPPEETVAVAVARKRGALKSK